LPRPPGKTLIDSSMPSCNCRIMDLLQSSYLNVLDGVADGIYLADVNRTVLFWNKGAERITGFSRDEVVGKSCADNVFNHFDDEGLCLHEEHCPLVLTMADGRERVAEVFLRHKDSRQVPVQIKTVAVTDELGNIVGGIETFTDRTEVHEALKKVDMLTEQSLIDPLTNVGNRQFADLELGSRFDELDRYGWAFAAAMCSVDDYSRLVEEFGPEAGGKALQLVVDILKDAVRAFDFIARWSESEFLLLFPNPHDNETLTSILERQRTLVEASTLEVGGHSIDVTVSFGATIVLMEDIAESLFERLDKLLLQSREEGRNRVTVG